MTQKDKELLFKDISAKLSYGVMCQVDDGAAGLNDGKLVDIDISKEVVRFDADYYWDAYIDDVKPYLRPLSSMTEEEKEELKQISNDYLNEWENTKTSLERWKLDAKVSYLRFVFYNSHHFDWNDLISKGLAIEVTENNNPYKE